MWQALLPKQVGARRLGWLACVYSTQPTTQDNEMILLSV